MDGVEVRNMDRREFIRNAALAGIAMSQSGCALQAVTRLPKAVEANLALEKRSLAILTNWAPRGGWFDLEVIEAIARSRIPLPTEWIKRVEAHPEMFSNDELRARWLAAKVIHGVNGVDCLDGEDRYVRETAAWQLVSSRSRLDTIRRFLITDRTSECWPTSVLLEQDRLLRDEFTDWIVHGKPLTAQWAAVSFLDPIPPEEILPRVLPAFPSLDPQVQIVVLRSFFNWPASQYDGEFWKLIAQVPDPSEIVGLEHFSNCAGDTARRCGLYGDIIQFSRTHVAAIMAAERCLEMSHGEIPDNLRLVAERMDALLDLPDQFPNGAGTAIARVCRWLLGRGHSIPEAILRSATARAVPQERNEFVFTLATAKSSGDLALNLMPAGPTHVLYPETADVEDGIIILSPEIQDILNALQWNQEVGLRPNLRDWADQTDRHVALMAAERYDYQFPSECIRMREAFAGWHGRESYPEKLLALVFSTEAAVRLALPEIVNQLSNAPGDKYRDIAAACLLGGGPDAARLALAEFRLRPSLDRAFLYANKQADVPLETIEELIVDPNEIVRTLGSVLLTKSASRARREEWLRASSSSCPS